VRELYRRGGHCRGRHEGKGSAPHRERREPCAYDCRRFGPHDRKADTEKGNAWRQVSRAVRPSAFPIGVARVDEDVIDADRTGNQCGALVAGAFEEQDRETNWCDGKLRRQR